MTPAEVPMAESEPESFVVIDRPYLLVTNRPYFVDEAGRLLFERLWHHDLVQHLTYLSRMTLAAPIVPLSEAPSDLVALEADLRAGLTVVPLPRSKTRGDAFRTLVPTTRTIWRSVGQAEIVHSVVAGWPYPLGWLAYPMAKLRAKKSVTIVESAQWRLGAGGSAARPSLRKRLEAAVHEKMTRWCCSKAEVSFYTQPVYLEQFHRPGKGAAYVAPAIWVNSEDVLSEADAIALWDCKQRQGVRFIFAARLVPEKGVNVLLHAVAKLAAAGVGGAVDIIGEGPLREAVARVAAESAAGHASFRVNYLDPVPYGAPFFELLQRYHALLVTNLGDEQPRVVFDAAARAVPVIASATDGLRPHVEHQRTGLLVPPGDIDALVAAMMSWATNPTPLTGLGLRALSDVRHQTHRAMHARRSQILARHLAPPPAGASGLVHSLY
jgi:glycosyltransferase involved in cell wall biosynthesis